MADQFLLDLVRRGFGLVDLVQRHHDGHVRGLRVVDGLDGLRHHAVIGSNHQDDDVRRLRAPRTHGGERLVARGIEECHHASCSFDMVGADMLRNPAGFP